LLAVAVDTLAVAAGTLPVAGFDIDEDTWLLDTMTQYRTASPARTMDAVTSGPWVSPC
jgi:hypothetical protein